MTAPDEAVEAAKAAILSEFSVDEDVGEYDATAVWGTPDAVVRAVLAAAAPFIAAQASSREWGVTYADESGDLHTEWGYTRNPFEQIDKDGEFQTGKRTWAKAYEILSRPKNAQTSEWQADDCPWKATS